MIRYAKRSNISLENNNALKGKCGSSLQREEGPLSINYSIFKVLNAPGAYRITRATDFSQLKSQEHTRYEAARRPVLLNSSS